MLYLPLIPPSIAALNLHISVILSVCCTLARLQARFLSTDRNSWYFCELEANKHLTVKVLLTFRFKQRHVISAALIWTQQVTIFSVIAFLQVFLDHMIIFVEEESQQETNLKNEKSYE